MQPPPEPDYSTGRPNTAALPAIQIALDRCVARMRTLSAVTFV